MNVGRRRTKYRIVNIEEDGIKSQHYVVKGSRCLSAVFGRLDTEDEMSKCDC